MAEYRVQIEHPITHERFDVSIVDFGKARLYRDPVTGQERTYAEAGFRITANGDGTAYVPPTPPAEPAARAIAAPEPEVKTQEPAPKAAEKKEKHRG